MAIEGKVAEILNEREVIINRGSEAGVEPGMTFRVTTPDIPVRDPDTRETLGQFSRDKIGVKATEVFPKFSIGRTYETYLVRSSLEVLGEGLRGVAQDLTGNLRKVRTLRIGGGSTLAPLSEEDSIVQVGDKVVQVVEAHESVHPQNGG